jgi:hypothetical protein
MGVTQDPVQRIHYTGQRKFCKDLESHFKYLLPCAHGNTVQILQAICAKVEIFDYFRSTDCNTYSILSPS